MMAFGLRAVKNKLAIITYFTIFQLPSITSPERKDQGRLINGRTFLLTEKLNLQVTEEQL